MIVFFIIHDTKRFANSLNTIIVHFQKNFLKNAVGFNRSRLIELKWNKNAETAIQQIKNRHYPDSFKGLGREIILVGITYDKDAPVENRKHICKIEKVEME